MLMVTSVNFTKKISVFYGVRDGSIFFELFFKNMVRIGRFHRLWVKARGETILQPSKNP